MVGSLFNIGVHEGLDSEARKFVRIVNSVSLFTLLIVLAIIIFAVVKGLPVPAVVFFSLIFGSCLLPLVFNHFKKYTTSKIYYLLSAYAIILSLPVMFGPDLHYQYFLVGGIGMPLLFLKNEVGPIKWILSALAILIWIYLEIHFQNFEALISIPTEYLLELRIVNDFLLFITVFTMFFIFTAESQKHIEVIQKKTLEVEDLNKELEHFAYIASHDLKAPLNNIVSLIDMIKEDHGEEMSEDLKKLFDMIEQRSDRMSDLVSSILSYSKAGKSVGKTTTFSMNECLLNVTSLISVPDGFTIEHEEFSFEITGAYIQLEQVLTNLVGNAIKYHDKQVGKIVVSTSPVEGDFIKIAVTDDGPGIKKEYQQRIFNVFESANEESRTDSTGVGLAIVKKLVEKNGGTFGLESEYGKGSTFWFTWPLEVV